MIYGYFGDIGGGKTLAMTRHAYLLHVAGYNIYSNYSLNFPHTYIDKDFIEEIINEDKDLGDNNVFVLDELGIWADSRRSMSNVDLTYFAKQVRKKDVRLLYSEQMKHAVDKRIRQLTRTEILCHSKKIKFINSSGDLDSIVIIYMDIYINNVLKMKKRIIGNKFFGMYDTKELVVKPSNKKENDGQKTLED